jgi:hypothetical protein
MGSSYQMRHVETGVLLLGYQVLCATDAEIEAANARLISAGNRYRLEPCSVPSPTPAAVPTLVTEHATAT